MDKQTLMPSTSSRKPYMFYGYMIVLAGFFIMAIMWGAAYSFGVFLKPLAANFGWTRAMTSGSYSMFMFAMGLLCMVTGRLNDRFGPRIVMTACGLFLGLGYMLMSQISTLWQMYLFYIVLVGVGMSGAFVPLASSVARWFVKRRGLMSGIVTSGTSVGVMFGAPVAGWIISGYSWRTSYFIMGIATLILLTLTAQFFRKEPAMVGQLPDGESVLKQDVVAPATSEFSPREALRTRQFWMIFVIYVFWGTILNATLVHIVPHATDLGISAISAASILTVMGGVNIIGRLGLCSIADRIGNKPAMIIGFLFLSVSLLSLQFAREIWMFYLFAIVFGIGYGGVATLVSTLVAELFGMRMHGSILGMVIFGWSIGGAIGATVSGHIFDITNSYYVAFFSLALLSVAGLILTSFLKPVVKKA